MAVSQRGSGRPREFDMDGVLDAAMEVFWTKGYAATSTEDLCGATDLSRSSLYNAFRTKQALYEAAVARYADRGIALQVEILDRPGTAKERLSGLMWWVVETDLADPEHRGCLAINAAIDWAGRDPKVTKLVRGQFARLEGAIHDTVLAGQRDGEITTDRSASAITRSFLSTYYGLRVLGRVADRAMLDEVIMGTLATL